MNMKQQLVNWFCLFIIFGPDCYKVMNMRIWRVEVVEMVNMDTSWSPCIHINGLKNGRLTDRDAMLL